MKRRFLVILFASGSWLVCSEEQASKQKQPFQVRAEVFASGSLEPKSEAQAVRLGDTIAVSFEGWYRIDSINFYTHP